MFKIIKYITSISLLVVFFLILNTTVVSAKNIQVTGLEALFDNMMNSKLEKYHIPNVTISVVKDGEIVYKKGFGFADIEGNIPVDTDTTLFRIGSTSKLITWTAVMQLVEDGKLDLNADVNSYLDFEIPPELIKSPNKTTTEPITITHLMTHTSGFEDYPNMLFRLSADELLPLNEYIKNYLPSRIYPAGEVAAYSNYGTALAGYIVERVSGLPFSKYVEKNIFLPLKMNKSTFKQPLPSGLASNMSKPYRFVEGEYVEGDFEFLIPEPAGSMSSTAEDMAKFMIAHLEGGAYNGVEILKKETADIMHKQHFTYHPELGGMTLGFMEGVFNNQRVIFHGGGTMLYSTGLYLLPEKNMGIFISYSGGNHLFHSEIFQEFMDYHFSTTFPLNQKPPESSKERAQTLLGEYQMNRRSITTLEKFNSLLMGVINVDVDEAGYLLVTHGGETNKFIEIEPGMYSNLREGRTQDYFGTFKKIIFDKDPDGRIMITTDGPMTYSKAPFYATMNFTASALIIILSILIGSLIFWIVRGVIGLFKRRKNQHSKPEAIGLLIATAFSIVFLMLLAGILSTGGIDPVYQLPRDAYIPVEASPVQKLTPMLMSILTFTLIIFTGFAWWRSLWSKIGRIHYTLYSSAALGLMLIFSYWNVFTYGSAIM